MPLPCLAETLATDLEKATFVRSLTIELFLGHTNENRRRVTTLTNALANMHSLSDLSVVVHPFYFDGWIENMNNVLW